MTRWPGIRRVFRLDRGDVTRGVDEELRFHFEMKVDDLVRRGLSPHDARVEAERQFGDVSATRRQLTVIDRSREQQRRRGEWLGNIGHDLRFAARGVRLRPWFAAAVVITLGLGIGANVTMFGVVDRLLFRPPAYLVRPSEVNRVYLLRTFSGAERAQRAMAYPRYQDLTSWTSTLARTAAVFDNPLAVGTGELVQEMPVEEVSGSFWSLFTMRPVLGRFFTPDEDRAPTGTAVAVLGYGYWQAAFAGATDVIGRTLQIGSKSYTIIGVAPRGFMGVATEAPAAFLPITAAAVELGGYQYNRGYGLNWMSMVVRRKPGVSAEQASRDLSNAYLRSYAVQRTLQRSAPPAEIARPRAVAAPLLAERGPNQGSDSKVATWLIAVAAIVLVIACANVGNLLLARALSRRREIAVRLALGVSRSRLVGQLLSESLLLATIGGVFGLAVAHWGGAIIRRSLLPDAAEVSTWTDIRLLSFTLLAVVFAGAIAGIVPAIQTTRADIITALKAGGRTGGHSRSRVRNSLLVVQTSLSLVLLVGAGLFVRSLHRAHEIHLGYDADRVLWASVQLRGTKLSDAEGQQLKWRMLTAVRALPEVESASRIVSVPFELDVEDDLYINGIDSAGRLGSFQQQSVSGDYFRTMGTAIIRGGPITDAHSADSSRVMVVSQSMAHVLWPHADPIGQCVRVSADTVPCTSVIGVAEDIKTNSLDRDPGLIYYLPVGRAGSDGGVFVRTRGTATPRAETIRRTLQRAMPGVAYVTVKPFADIILRETRSWQLGATMFTVFGGLALLVAAVGLYSVVAYGVAQRRHELGIRMALGAHAGDVVRLVLSEVLRTAIIAVVIGAAVALIAGRRIQPLLFDVSPRDPLTFFGCAAVILATATVASVIPALRAGRTDPNVALRAE
jgi:putative ABC transport system permease protein